MLMLFEFRLWLEDKETYDKKFKPRADKASLRLAGKHPFAHWFPEGQERLALPLKAPALSAASHFLSSPDYLSPEDKMLVAGLAELGYQVVDYRQGYVKRGAGVEKIGGLLEKLIKNADSDGKRVRYQQWSQTFINSAARKDKSMDGGNNMWILISHNSHDIAQMSYDREWSSCMELEDGIYKNTPFCVIRTGGMVAYLLRQPEAEVSALVTNLSQYIDKPIARMSIKAAYNTSDKGQVIAVPETRVYPQNIRGFYETVFDWVEQHQGDMGSGKYKVLGGYSDDNGGEQKYRVHHRASRNPEELMTWLNSHIEARHKAAIKLVLDSRREFPESVYKKVKELLMGMTSSWGHHSDNTETKQLLFLYKKHPEMFSEEDKTKLPYFVKERADLLGRHDRVVSEFGKQFSSPLKGNNPNKPADGDMKKLIHHLGEVLDGKAKFDDSHSVTTLIDYVIQNGNELQHIHNKTTTQLVRDEMLRHATVTASWLINILAKHDLKNLFQHNRGLGSSIERLIENTLEKLQLNDRLIADIQKLVEKVYYSGSSFFARTLAYKMPSILYQYKDNDHITEELAKFKTWLDELVTKDAYRRAT